VSLLKTHQTEHPFCGPTVVLVLSSVSACFSFSRARRLFFLHRAASALPSLIETTSL